MASPHSGFLKETVELLRVETDLFDLYISGRPFHPTVKTLNLHKDESEEVIGAALEVIPAKHGLKLSIVKVFSPGQCGLVDLGAEPVYPCFYETQAYELVIQKKTDKSVEFHHDNILLRMAVKPLGKELLSGVLNFGNEVGYTDLEIRVGGQSSLILRLEIFPSKMDYKRDYQMILKDVNEQVYNLAFDFLRKTYNLTGLKETKYRSLTEFFTILSQVFRQLTTTVDRIQAVPHQRLMKVNKVMDSNRVKKAGRENLKFLAHNPHFLVKDARNGFIRINMDCYSPVRLIESKRKINYDTQENRFLRWMLTTIKQKLRKLKVRLAQMERANDPVLMRRLDNMEAQLGRLLKADFLVDVGEMRQMTVSLVLQMAPGYRDVYRIYLILMKGLAIQGDLFRLSLKDLAQLYEYWCFLKLNSILKKKYKLVKQDIIRVRRGGLFVTLDQSQKASVTYLNPKNGETFGLFYNSMPRKSGGRPPTLAQKPDNVLSLRKKESKVDSHYVFDAKYRINPAYVGTSYRERYEHPGPEEDDINTMHRYRDAIVYENQQTGDFERGLYGAYVLFPYQDEELFREHRFYKSIKKVNVGAFPFLPNSTALMEEFLDELILDSPEKAYERSTRPRGTESYYKDKLSGKDVLVGALKDKAQLAVCLERKFYHIPLKRLFSEQTVLTQMKYVAIYQSRTLFGEKESGVSWIGQIERWEVVPRGQIKERPARRGRESELYVRFTIKEWTRLTHVVKPGGNFVYSHLFTTKYILDRAEELAELRLATDEELGDWREKRRLGKVKVELDHEYVDKAGKVLGVRVVR